MKFEDILAITAAILVILLLVIVNYKNFNSRRKIVSKVLLLVLTLFLALPSWYLVQLIVTFSLAQIIPTNKIVNCIDLNEGNCKKRPDCDLSYPIGGLGKEIKPICVNK